MITVSFGTVVGVRVASIVQITKTRHLLQGKGYPNEDTRRLAHRMHNEWHLPVLALVDSDPHGFEVSVKKS